LRVFEKRALKIFECKREEVAGGWRRLHNEDLHNLYASPSIRVIKSRRMRWTGHVAHMGEMRNVYEIFVINLDRKRPHGRPRHGWADSIATDLREKGWEGVDWMHLTQDRDHWWALVNVVMDLCVP
jgi:hypothetical protein